MRFDKVSYNWLALCWHVLYYLLHLLHSHKNYYSRIVREDKLFEKINLPRCRAYKFRKLQGKVVFIPVPFACSSYCFPPLWGRDHSKKNLAPIFISQIHNPNIHGIPFHSPINGTVLHRSFQIILETLDG